MKPVKNLKKLFGAALAASALILTGCGGSSDTATEAASAPLKIGVISGPETDVMKAALEKAKKDSGLEAELVEFQDYITPNVALSDKSIDVNAIQHKPYLDSMVNDRGFKLTIVGNTFVYPIAAFSEKFDELDELPDSAKISIPNDPSNEGRSLILLHNTGLITLKDPGNLEATPKDIIGNPKNLKFVELEAPLLPRSLQDVDLSVINNTFAVPAGLTLDKAILVEDKKSPYVNIIVSREDNKDDPRIAQLVAAYQSDEVASVATDLFKGGAVKGW
ncbi:MetQ/NlpA family ABC transporter substrate-binding protein [Sansalvadorimonas sp. 2012CJ34-2]|uniref:Lipoprotein n=1 Tax=Parendozoicomonas callyspongiae TaxID=2942213 RepID=A0ABT0PH89_9GAMM|nr:MetQ/NlpA family ABC transporter substrate-binding protein [Sansalvadorimonas sp. 2012CJ34-2]MCL6270698.1 MetQ/NlpA family ABC transporter substrate-binding protein [Sansalvadorimonas sp. 2012CJ34-2]